MCATSRQYILTTILFVSYPDYTECNLYHSPFIYDPPVKIFPFYSMFLVCLASEVRDSRCFPHRSGSRNTLTTF